ncbi:hypothetical protein AB6A40_002326 [Gnathostoma spinigerum]|uniref:PLAT domain-containing protein n=1 Tax=Gnathostoma spinigerum TaxID=75299 RepID=A0ABD6EG01_9BILA
MNSPASDSSSGAPMDCAYSVVVRTSAEKNASTTANVFVQDDLFLLTDQTPLAALKTIEIWHEKKGECRPWLLHSVNVIEHLHHYLYQFPCNKWFGENKDEVVTNMKLEVAGTPFRVLTEEDM